MAITGRRVCDAGGEVKAVNVPLMLDRQMIFVTGKGGVGKSTVAGALGMAAAARGRRTIVCELGAQDRLAPNPSPA